jgi:hypothetical protein
MSKREKFWALVFVHKISALHLPGICQVSPGRISEWLYTEPTDQAIQNLENHIGIESEPVTTDPSTV